MADQAPKRPVRIMNISGSPVDQRWALAKAAASDEPVDVFVGDWMSELNMPLRAYEISRGEGLGYESTFLEALEPALENLAKKGAKLAANAGVVATKALFDAVVAMVANKGLDLTVAWVEGDAVLETVKAMRAAGSKFTHISAGIDLDDWGYEPLFAQCYLGGKGIVRAFEAGADIVICGRVADASPIVAAAAWWHGWFNKDNESDYPYDALAQSLMAGHLIECSMYVTGGNYSGFKTRLDLTRPYDFGYPIAEIAADGDVVITKNAGTGGVVNIETCKEQLLYEIQGKFYLNCDVTAVIDNATFAEIGTDRVRLSGITGLPPPATTKVGLTADGGYSAEIHWAVVGLDIEEKKKMLELQLRHSFGPAGLAKFSLFKLYHYGSVPINPKNQNAATVDVRLVAQSRDITAFDPVNFVRPALDFVMASIPAATTHPNMQSAKPRPIQEYFPALIPQPAVTVHFSKPDLADIVVPPPTKTIEHPWKQPSTPATADPVDLASFGPTTSAPLGYVALGRAGDKGSNCNVGFYVRDEQQWPWLRTLLSTEKFIELMEEEFVGQKIDRMEFPGLWAVHFLIHDHLDRGVTANATYDVLGKFIAEYIRAKLVDVPTVFLSKGPV